MTGTTQALEFRHIGCRHSLGSIVAFLEQRIVRIIPNALGNRLPCCGGVLGFRAQLFGGFLLLKIGRMSTCALDHFGQLATVFQDGTWTEQIVAERLLAVVLHKNGRLQRLKQGDLANIGIGVMRENARVDVARRIDVQIAPSASNENQA